MRQFDARLSRLEQRLSANKPPCPSFPEVSVEEVVKEFDRVAEAAQQCQLPGIPIRWLFLSRRRRKAVVSYLCGQEGAQPLLEEIEALEVVERADADIRRGTYSDYISVKPKPDNGRWYFIAEYERGGERSIYEANCGALVFTWASKYVREAAVLNSQIIEAFCAYSGSYFNWEKRAYYVDRGMTSPRIHDTGELDGCFEIKRIRIEERGQQ